MVKTNVNSTIEVWNEQYINNPKKRRSNDTDKIILQMEYAYSNNFMVEVILDAPRPCR